MAWKGMLDYATTNGVDEDYMGRSDHWGGCTPHFNNTRCPVGDYQEDTFVIWDKE